jgi:hypothetical protein
VIWCQAYLHLFSVVGIVVVFWKSGCTFEDLGKFCGIRICFLSSWLLLYYLYVMGPSQAGICSLPLDELFYLQLVSLLICSWIWKSIFFVVENIYEVMIKDFWMYILYHSVLQSRHKNAGRNYGWLEVKSIIIRVECDSINGSII